MVFEGKILFDRSRLALVFLPSSFRINNQLAEPEGYFPVIFESEVSSTNP